MTSHTLSTGGIDSQLRATFLYDGAGNRVQQIDYTGSTPVTTTYTNDIVGLAQVLVAADGVTEVYNLWGLRLLAQDDGETVRLPLTDGLGSVRVEMVGNGIESATTYDPYGNLLAHTGTSGTTYGFTGEQHDVATGLLYLRARYYNPALRSFMGKDAWSGSRQRPQSMNGWSYAMANPINFTDPTGRIPDRCKQGMSDKVDYVRCVARELGVETDRGKLTRYKSTGSSGDTQFDNTMNSIADLGQGCYSGSIPYRAPGYLENIGFQYLEWAPWSWPVRSIGVEIVYDFATFERAHFSYSGWHLSDAIASSYSESVGIINGFRSWQDIEFDYSGDFVVLSLGGSVSVPFLKFGGISAGKSMFLGSPDSSVWGFSTWAAIGGGLDAIPPLDASVSKVTYTMDRMHRPYYRPDGTVDTASLRNDIIEGRHSPWQFSVPVLLEFFPYLFLGEDQHVWAKLDTIINTYSRAYEENHKP
jgi:RHS repeat-associated protein